MVYAVGGSFLFAFGVNVLITPLGLYNGGFMGIAQLIRTFIVQVIHVPVPAGVDLSGIIYFIMNIPLFYMATGPGEGLCGEDAGDRRHPECVPDHRAHSGSPPGRRLPHLLHHRRHRGGTGTGLILRGRSSGGGQDIIGLCCTKKYPGFSVAGSIS